MGELKEENTAFEQECDTVKVKTTEDVYKLGIVAVNSMS